MYRAPSFRTLSSLGLALALATPLACAKSGEGEDEPDAEKADGESKTAEVAEGGDADGTKSAPSETKPEEGGLTKTVAEGVAAAAQGGRLDRGVALGHFVMPNPSGMLEEIRTKVVPAKNAAFLNESMLRSLAGMQLGSRSGVAEHISLKDPMGCVLVEETATEVPVACIIGYEGGAAAVVTDLGESGKVPDAEGHVAHYRVDGNDIYLDDLAGQVVISNHTKIFEGAKGYLETNIVGRASSIGDDLEVVLYPKAAMSRYSEQVDTLVSTMRSATAMAPSTGNPVTDAFTQYSKSSFDTSLDFYRETEQFDFGMGLSEVGFVFRYAAYPEAGSGIQADAQALSAGPLDPKLLTSLPEQSWLVSGYTLDWEAAWGIESATVLRDVLVEVYAKEVGRDAATVGASIEAYLKENAELYGKDTAMAVMHLPGTQGGLVLSRSTSKAGRDSWKTWSEGFGAEAVLGSEGAKKVTWSFEPGALEVDGIPVDRWTIEPGPDAKAEIAKKADPTVAEIERRFGGLKLVIDRVELDDRVMFVVAPGAQEKYLQAAIAAAKGGPSTGSDAGLTKILARNPEASGLMAVDVAGAMSWAREVLPAEATAKLPPGLGSDLSDFFFAITYAESGAQRGEMVLSQGMIDQLRALAG